MREKLTEIEWPNGSRRKALYSPEEISIMKGYVAQCEAGEITQQELGRMMDLHHDVKMTGGYFSLVDADEAEAMWRDRAVPPGTERPEAAEGDTGPEEAVTWGVCPGCGGRHEGDCPEPERDVGQMTLG